MPLKLTQRLSFEVASELIDLPEAENNDSPSFPHKIVTPIASVSRHSSKRSSFTRNSIGSTSPILDEIEGGCFFDLKNPFYDDNDEQVCSQIPSRTSNPMEMNTDFHGMKNQIN